MVHHEERQDEDELHMLFEVEPYERGQCIELPIVILVDVTPQERENAAEETRGRVVDEDERDETEASPFGVSEVYHEGEEEEDRLVGRLVYPQNEEEASKFGGCTRFKHKEQQEQSKLESKGHLVSERERVRERESARERERESEKERLPGYLLRHP